MLSIGAIFQICILLASTAGSIVAQQGESVPTTPEITQVFQMIIISVIGVSVASITYEVVKWARVKIKIALASLSAQQLALLQAGAGMVVRFVEQSGFAKLIEDTATAKKAEAVKALQAFCDERNLPFDVNAINIAIEDAIKQGLHKVNSEDAQG